MKFATETQDVCARSRQLVIVGCRVLPLQLVRLELDQIDGNLGSRRLLDALAVTWTGLLLLTVVFHYLLFFLFLLVAPARYSSWERSDPLGSLFDGVSG